MEAKDIKQQIKLGAFVAAGLALFLVSVFFIGAENNIFSRTFNVAAVFRNVEGLKEGDNVWLSGVKIGTVTDVRILSQGKVVVKLALKNDQHHFITKDAVASVGSDGLVGNKLVVIRPGKSNEVLQETDTLNTNSPTDTQELINIAKDVGDNTRSLTNDLKIIAKKINDGHGIVGELLNEGDVARDLREAVASLKATGQQTAKLSGELNALVSQMRTGEGLLPTLLNDTSYSRSFTQALTNVKEVSNNAAVVSQNLEELSMKMNSNESAVGVLLHDSAFAENLKNTMTNAETATEKLDENMEALQHNFLLRGFFRKQERQRERERKREASSSKGNASGR